MSWREDCAAGKLYDATAPEREAEHLRCADLCWEYNNTRPSDTERREHLFRQTFGKRGPAHYVEPTVFFGFGYNVEAGDRFFANNNCVFVDPGKIRFGDDVLVGPGCTFVTVNHALEPERRLAGIMQCKGITVGNNVWFGAEVTVCPGVTIGDDCVIGAGSVVVKDIPSGSIAVGNPCRVVRKADEKEI